MKTRFLAPVGALVGVLAAGSAHATGETPVKSMLDGIDTAKISSEIATWGGLAVGVFLAIAAIPLAKRLLGSVMGGR